jgi:hypothetical protein
MSGSRDNDLPAAQWAHQQNIGETGEDRQDKINGVRCKLQRDPCDGLHLAQYAASSIVPGGLGYAPEYIRRSSDIPGVEYVYRWSSRSKDGVHHYGYLSRQGFDPLGRRHNDVKVELRGGPLAGHSEWVQLPESGELPDILRTVGSVQYRRDNAMPGPTIIFRGNMHCRCEKGGKSAGVLELLYDTPSSSSQWRPPLEIDRSIWFGTGTEIYRWSHRDGDVEVYRYNRPLQTQGQRDDSYW